jgi:hypothetical protein
MSKIFASVLFVLFSLVLSNKLQSKCITHGGDCDLTSYCCSNLVCKDYRCQPKGTSENQVAWAPDGEKCDWFHHCGDNYSCQSHRCVFKIKSIVKALSKKVKKIAENQS